MLWCLIFYFLLLCLLYYQHQLVSKTELLCACYDVWLFSFSFSVYSIINISWWVKVNYLCMLPCLINSFLLLCLLYDQHQKVSGTELLCACYVVWLFLFSFSVYFIINISWWVKVNYLCMLRCLIIFSPSLYTLWTTSEGEWNWIIACMLWCLIFIFSFSVYSISNNSRWVKQSYCVHVTLFVY